MTKRNNLNIAKQVFAILSAHKRHVGGHRQCSQENCSLCAAVQLPKILRQIEQDRPIRMLLPAFPAKSANPKKTLGHLPDHGELLALRMLNTLCAAINKIYVLGAEIIICSDGRVFNDLVFVSDRAVNEYQQQLQWLINKNNLTNLSMFSLDDVFPTHDYAAMRTELAQFNTKPKIENLAQFNGMHRFLFEDSLYFYPELSKNQVRKRAKALTYKVMQRSNAWSELIKTYFPSALRLSIHPQACGSDKLGIKMIPSSSMWATPWHNVLVVIDDQQQLMQREVAEAMGAKLIYDNNKPSYFLLTNSAEVANNEQQQANIRQSNYSQA